jgi:hypothetical protein
VTEALAAGVPLQDVQDAAGHADPRTTRRYDRSRHNLDRHPTYVLVLNVIEDEELGVTLAAAVGVMEKAPPGDSGGAFVVGLAC